MYVYLIAVYVGSDLATAATVVPPLLPGERLVAGGAVEALSIRHPTGTGREVS